MFEGLDSRDLIILGQFVLIGVLVLRNTNLIPQDVLKSMFETFVQGLKEAAAKTPSTLDDKIADTVDKVGGGLLTKTENTQTVTTIE